MYHLGLVQAVDRLRERIVVAVTHAADRGFNAGLGEPLGVADRHILGGFKRLSQHLDGGGCDGYAEAPFGSVRARRVAVTRSALGGTARGSSAVLGGGRGGSVERGRGDRGRRVARGGDTLVPGGGRNATKVSCAISQATLRAVSGVR